MNSRTFAEIYCEHEGVSPGELPAVLFRRTLFPHARLVVALLRWINPRHFLADNEFIEDVLHLRSLGDFSMALGSYIEHPSNRGMLRRRLHLRVSARRMLRLVRAVFAPDMAPRPSSSRNTLEPFGERPSAPAAPRQKQDKPFA